MLQVTVVAVGSLKERYWREAAEEYEKRLRGFCKLTVVQIRESRLSDEPGEKEIAAALENEGKQILANLPPKSYRMALCVEGKQLSSRALAEKLGEIGQTRGSVSLVIGSSFGLSEEVKRRCDFQLSVSELTFPHQLMRVLLLETLYRSFSILQGGKYHK